MYKQISRGLFRDIFIWWGSIYLLLIDCLWVCTLWKTVVIFSLVACEKEEYHIYDRAQYPPTATVNIVITTDLHTNIRYKNQYA